MKFAILWCCEIPDERYVIDVLVVKLYTEPMRSYGIKICFSEIECNTELRILFLQTPPSPPKKKYIGLYVYILILSSSIWGVVTSQTLAELPIEVESPMQGFLYNFEKKKKNSFDWIDQICSNFDWPVDCFLNLSAFWWSGGNSLIRKSQANMHSILYYL